VSAVHVTHHTDTPLLFPNMQAAPDCTIVHKRHSSKQKRPAYRLHTHCQRLQPSAKRLHVHTGQNLFRVPLERKQAPRARNAPPALCASAAQGEQLHSRHAFQHHMGYSSHPTCTQSINQCIIWRPWIQLAAHLQLLPLGAACSIEAAVAPKT